MNQLPLSGIRVTDFTWAVAGPVGTQLMAVMGADVIKVESSKRLDQLREGEPYADHIPGVNRSGRFNNLNLCKKSITVDLKQPEAIDLVRQLIKVSDVVIENFAYGVMDKFGLGHDALRKLRSDLIVVSSIGLGSTGPRKHYVAYGNTLHAFSGLTALTGYYNGPPQGIGGTYSDPLTGITAIFAILAALNHRDQTGEGQYIDLSMAEATLVQLPEAVMDYMMNGRVRKCEGNRDDIMAPHNTYRCKGDDSWVAIAVGSEEEWLAFCKAIGEPAWTKDDKFADTVSRWRNQDELDKLVSEWTRTRTSYEVMETLQKAGVASGPSFNLKELVTDPHLNERGYFFEQDHPEAGRKVVSGLPWRMSQHPDLEYKPAPLLGQHNDYAFHELLGFSQADVEKMTARGILS